MRIDEHTVEWHGDRVEIAASDGRTATARWSNGKLVERSGSLVAELDRAASWETLEREIARKSDALIESSMRAAYDARGVDVTQIDRMLALSPGDRLRTLDSHRLSILRLRRDARIR